VRFVPHSNHIVAEIVYKIEGIPMLPDNGRYMGIDMGVGNFAVLASNVMAPLIINGGNMKSINQYYNKQDSHHKAVETAMRPITAVNGSTHCKQTKRLQSQTAKRNARVKDGLHKITRYIIEVATWHNISKIIVGKNDGWKQNIRIGKQNTQNFVQLPHGQFIELLRYKAKAKGIEVIAVEESYTSKTSHLDGEQPVKHETYSGERVSRGLFRAGNGTNVNADVNGAAQIMRKVFPMAVAYGIEGGVNPVKVVVG
jgi:putative transposase